ncbi:hypothetical protein QC590_10300 [Pseudomonas putida]|uniref:hypothetical protein n=1 Tax=Pseudomonas putida TaxID=303 RepID=UPI0033581E29
MILTKSEQKLGFEHCDLEGNRPIKNFRYLLYAGGAAANQNSVDRLIAAGSLGAPRPARQRLVSLFHGHFERQFKINSRKTIKGDIYSLRQLYIECDKLGVDLNVGNVSSYYESYSLDRWQQVLQGVCTVSAETAYTQDRDMLAVINAALEIPAGVVKSAFDYSELRRRGLTGGMKVDKSSSSEGFQFGADLLDVIDSLSVGACFGELPVVIGFSDGTKYDYWGAFRTPDQLKEKAASQSLEGRSPGYVRRLARDRAKRYKLINSYTRASFLNIRVHAEFNLFLAQTGLNVSTAFGLPYEDYRCTTIDGGCRIEAYKPRKESDVEVFAYSEYKDHFLKYLRWLREVYPEGCDYLFPFRSKEGARAEDYKQSTFKKFMSRAGRKCLSAESVRKIRVNWMLRETHDPKFVAIDAQHAMRTLLETYSTPSQEIAYGEWSAFFAKRKSSRLAVLDGECTPRSASPLVDSPVKPDCMNPAGCLFCDNYHGRKSLDYIWSLATYRYLKFSEFKLIPINRDIVGSPQKMVVDRIDEIMAAFSNQDEQCRAWMEEAELRILEHNFHGNYRGLIEVRFDG